MTLWQCIFQFQLLGGRCFERFFRLSFTTHVVHFALNVEPKFKCAMQTKLTLTRARNLKLDSFSTTMYMLTSILGCWTMQSYAEKLSGCANGPSNYTTPNWCGKSTPKSQEELFLVRIAWKLWFFSFVFGLAIFCPLNRYCRREKPIE